MHVYNVVSLHALNTFPKLHITLRDRGLHKRHNAAYTYRTIFRFEFHMPSEDFIGIHPIDITMDVSTT